MAEEDDAEALPVHGRMPGPLRDRLVRKGLRLTHLRLLAALEATGQMSAAAAMLAISQPAASRCAAELEEIAGAKLYERHARGISLTLYGRMMARRARAVFREIAEADGEIARLKAGLMGEVRVGAVTGAAVEFVLPAIKAARLTHPQVDFSVVVDTSDNLITALDAGRVDFFLGRIPPTHDHRYYFTRLAGDEPISLVVREGHPLVRRREIDLMACAECDWVMQPPGGLLRRSVEAYLAERMVPLPKVVLSTASQFLTLLAITELDAIAPLSRSVVEFVRGEASLHGRVLALPVAGDLAVPPYAIAKLAGHALSPAAQMLFDDINGRF